MTSAESSAPAGQSITEHELAQCQRADKTGCTPVVFVQPGRIGWVGLCGASPKVVHQLRIHAAGSIPVHGTRGLSIPVYTRWPEDEARAPEERTVVVRWRARPMAERQWPMSRVPASTRPLS